MLPCCTVAVKERLGREFGGLTIHVLAKELQQEPAVLSRGLGKLTEKLESKPELRGVVETLCDSLRKGRGPKRSIRFARPYFLVPRWARW